MSKASLQRRVFQLEIYRPKMRGARHFATVDGALYVETTPICGHVDYRAGIPDPDGNFAPELPRRTREEVAAIEALGYSCSIVTWQAMT